MKAVIGAAVALAVLTGTALAQSAPPPPSPAPPNNAAPGAGAAPPPPGGPGGWDRQQGGRGEHMWHHPMFARSKAARFHIAAGEMNLGIKCPEDEPMKACADFTLQLLDKIGSLPQH